MKQKLKQPLSQSWTTAGSGTQSFTLTVSQSGQTTRVTASLTVVALPTAGISLPANLTVTCASPSVAITATGGSTYRWENTTTSAIRSITATGTYAVTVTSAGGCTATTSSLVTVTQNTTPPTLAISATNVCQGGAVRLSATAGLTSYTFSRSDGSTISSGAANTAIVSSLSAGSYTMTVRSVNSAGCSNTALTSVTVLALPSLTLTARNSAGAISNTLTCASPTLTLTAAGGTSYTFTGTGIASAGASATVSQTGTFTLTGRNASGCQNTTTITIQSNTATVTVNRPSTNTALAGVAFSQNFGALGGQAPHSFSIASGLLPSGLSLSTSGVLSGTPIQTGTFNVGVRGTDANGCSGLSSVYSLTVQSTDVGSLSVTPNAVCAGDRVTFAASVSGISGPYNFTLTNGTSTTTGTANSAAFSQSWTAAGSGLQTFTLTVRNNTFSDFVTNTLTVNPLPNAGISVPANLTLTCASPTVTLTATGGNTYRWEDNTTNAQRSINTSGTYTVTVTNGSGCTAIASQNVTVVQNTNLPSVNLLAANVCEGESVSLVATAGLSSYTFVGDAGTLDSGTDPSTEVTGLAAGVYSFTVRVVNSAGCVNTATTFVTVHTTPTLVASYSGLLTCARTSLTLTATGGNSYSFAGAGLVSQNPTAGTAVVNQTNLYSVTVTNTNTGCSSTTDISIGEDLTPPTVAISPASGTITCASPTLTLTATGGTSYTWTDGAGLPGHTGATLSVSASGPYSVTATGTNGCTASATVSIDQSAGLPEASIVASGTLTCAQTTVELTASAGGLSSVSYVFAGPSGGEPSGIVAQDGAAGTAEVNRSGLYSVTVTNTITGCSSATSTSVSQNTATPSASVNPASATLTCTTTFVSLTASGGVLAGISYLWSNGLTDADINVSSPGTYSVVVTADNGCTATASAVVSQSADLPTAGLVASGTISCAVPAITLTATGGDTYTFFGPEIISQESTAGTAMVGAGGSYGVIVSNTATGCTSSTLIEVSQNTTLPTVGINASHTVLTCTQTSLTLTASGTGTSYVWTGGMAGATLPVSTGGTYSVTAISDNGCTAVATSPLIDQNTLAPSVSIDPISATLTCSLSSLTLTASGDPGTSYAWTGGSTGATKPVSASGIYSVTATGANGCTIVRNTVVVESNTVITGFGVTASASVCAGAGTSVGSVTLTASGCVGGTVSWPGGITGNTFSTTVSGSYTATCTVGACSTTASGTATIGAGVTAMLSTNLGSVLTCAQTSLTLTATGGVSYTFSGPGLNQSGTGQTAVVNQSGTYSVTVANASGCTSATSTMVSSNTTAPTLSLNASNSLNCALTSATLTASATGFGSLTYAFRNSSGLVAGSPSTNSTVALSTAGNYSVLVTATNGCTVGQSTSIASDASLPTVSISPTDGTLTCAQTSLTLMATASVTGLLWSTGATATSITVNGAGTYSVTATATNGCTAITNSVVVESNTVLVGFGVMASASVCAAGSVTLTASGCTGGTVAWPGGITGNTFSTSISGNYTATCTVGICTTTASGTATIGAAVTVTPTTNLGGTLTCDQTSLTLTATGGTSYTFAGPGLSQSGSMATAVVSQSGTFSVTAANASGCINTTSVVVSQNNSAPTNASLTASNSGTLTCSVPTITLTASAMGSSLSYVFAGSSGTLAGSGNTRPVSVSGLYSVTITGANGCATSANTTVFSNTLTPTAGLVASGTLTCAVPAVTLTASGGAGLPGSYYSFGGPGVVVTAGISATVNAGGTYSVTVTNPANGCSASTTVTVFSNSAGSIAAPTLSASSSAVCAGANVQVVATVSGSPTGLQWYKDGQAMSGQTSATLNLGGVQANQAGSYVLVISNGCSATSSPFSLTVNPLPTVQLSFPVGTSVSLGNPPTITLPNPLPAGSDGRFGVSGGIGYERVIIIDRINGFEIRQVDSSSTGRFMVNRMGLFTITVTDANGCRQTVQGIMAR